jgi:hypothetical protein
MGPINHLLLTILFFISLSFFFTLSIDVLIGALFITIFIDAFDHTIAILFSNNLLAKRVKKEFFKGNISKAYNIYFYKRDKVFKFAIFHNLIFLFICIILELYMKNFLLLIGPILHIFCDILTEYNFKKSINFWLYGWKNLLIMIKKKIL